MKQDAFIQRLRQGLSSLPRQDVDEIAADYREYIGDAVAAGRNEEEVIAALGDPDKLARELKAQATYRHWQARRSFGNLARVVASIAGLGLLNVILLVPFMVYLLLLTIGYLVSGAFAVGGLIAVVAIGSHHLFGWPPAQSPSIHVDAKAARQTSDAAAGDGHRSSADESNIGDVTLDGNYLVLKLDDGGEASIVTRAGVVEMKKEDGKFKIVALGAGADELLGPAPNDTYRIRIDDVVSMHVKNDDGQSVAIAHAKDKPSALIWDVSDEDGAGHVQFERDTHGNTKRLAVQSGKESVVIDASKGISIKDDDSDIRIVAPLGGSIAGMAFGYAFAMLAGGVIGLVVCLWLTRATWRALSRYVHRQIDALSAPLDEHGRAT